MRKNAGTPRPPRRRSKPTIQSFGREYAVRSLIALTDAASASPTASHRAACWAKLFEAAVRRDDWAGRDAGPDDLLALDASVIRNFPSYAYLMDFVPLDARQEVLTSWRGNLYHLLPGSLERPVALLNEIALQCEIVDPVLQESLGYGLGDLVELILRKMDDAWQHYSTKWAEPVLDYNVQPTLTAGEISAESTLVSWNVLVGECESPGRAAAALRAHTTSAQGLVAKPESTSSTFDSWIAVAHRNDLVSIPVGFLPETLLAISHELCATASRSVESNTDPLRTRVWMHVGRRLQGSSFRIRGPVAASKSQRIHSLIEFDERKILAVDVIGGLTADSVAKQIAGSASALKAFRAGVTFQTARGAEGLPDEAEVLHVQVIAGVPPVSTPAQGIQIFTLGDLEWILHTSHEVPEDLWYFIRDLVHRPSIESMFAFEVIDQWEVWRVNKSFHTSGSTVSFMMFSPHESVAEWNESARLAAAERAAHAAGLPPLRGWAIVAAEEDGRVSLGDTTSDTFLSMLTGSVPVVVHMTDPSANAGEGDILWGLADGIIWKLQRIPEVLAKSLEASDLAALQLRFARTDYAGGLAVRALGSEGQVEVQWHEGLEEALATNAAEVERICGQALAEAIGGPEASEFTAAWEQTPPAVRVDAFVARPRAMQLPSPKEPVQAIRRRYERDLAAHLSEIALEPGLYEDKAATALESQTIFPWLLEQLHSQLATFSVTSALQSGLTQLEYANRERFLLEQRIGWERGFPVQDGEGSAPRVESMLGLTRAISLIVEELLLDPPWGDKILHEADWGELLAIAGLGVDSCFRSDAIHQRLSNLRLELSDSFELSLSRSDTVTDIDLSAYQAARRVATRPEAVPIGFAADHAASDSGAEEGLLADHPALVPIDGSLRQTLGFGLESLLAVFETCVSWPTSTAAPIAHVQISELLGEIQSTNTSVVPVELTAAVDWLLLNRSHLEPGPLRHWETERRSHRLVNRPLIDDGAGVWVLPWSAETSLRVLSNYLTDGRLPWPNNSLPEEVRIALDQYRQRRNVQLEQDCVRALSDRGFVVRHTVKPNKARQLGISNLTGEIDVLCLDATRSLIWVIEAKDPYTPFSAYQIRRLVNDFYAPGKYVDRLLRKVQDVEESVDTIGTALGVKPLKQWTVMPLFVTRHVEPAAFAAQPKVQIVTIDEVAATVNRDHNVSSLAADSR